MAELEGSVGILLDQEDYPLVVDMRQGEIGMAACQFAWVQANSLQDWRGVGIVLDWGTGMEVEGFDYTVDSAESMEPGCRSRDMTVA